MKTTQDLPLDPLGSLGHPIRQAQAKPDTVRPFEAGNHGRDGRLIADTSTAVQTIVDTLRKKSSRDEEAE